MGLIDDIDKAKERLNQSIRHLYNSHFMFGVGKYEGLYHGNIRSWQFSKYLNLCKIRIIKAKKKLDSLERKL